jgi:hypothetical protein
VDLRTFRCGLGLMEISVRGSVFIHIMASASRTWTCLLPLYSRIMERKVIWFGKSFFGLGLLPFRAFYCLAGTWPHDTYRELLDSPVMIHPGVPP